jgi:hypothetical protein
MIWVRRLAMLGLVLSAAVLVVSALPIGQQLPVPIVIAPIVLAVPVFVITLGKLVVEVGTGARALWPLWRLLRETMPLWFLVASWLVFAGFWLVGMTAISRLPGTPQERDGVYTTNNHGAVTVISESEYLRFKAREQRIAPAVAGGFCVWGVVSATALLRRDAQKRAMPAPPTAG